MEIPYFKLGWIYAAHEFGINILRGKKKRENIFFIFLFPPSQWRL